MFQLIIAKAEPVGQSWLNLVTRLCMSRATQIGRTSFYSEVKIIHPEFNTNNFQLSLIFWTHTNSM